MNNRSEKLEFKKWLIDLKEEKKKYKTDGVKLNTLVIILNVNKPSTPIKPPNHHIDTASHSYR